MTNRQTRSKQSVILLLAVGAGLQLGACAWIPKGDAAFDVGLKDRGVASWYGGQFHGRQAADGQPYDMEGLTAAHRTMPLGSIVRVVNLVNGKYVSVRITDRGPYARGRVLDLSHAAAVRLGMEQEGLSFVQMEIVGERRPNALLSSDAQQALPHAYLFGSDGRNETSRPVMSVPVRLLPSDLWRTRRTWRVAAVLAANHTAHNEVVTLVLS